MPRSTSAPTAPAAFGDNAAHIKAELAWLELVLRREVVRARDRRLPAAGRDEFAGMYGSDEEIDAYINGLRDELEEHANQIEAIQKEARRGRESGATSNSTMSLGLPSAAALP